MAAGAGHSAATMRLMTRFAARTPRPDVVRSRSQASHDVAVSIASRHAARAGGGNVSSSGPKASRMFSSSRPSAVAMDSLTPDEDGHPPHQGTPHGRDLLVERGAVPDDALDLPVEAQPRGPLGQAGPQTAQLQRGDEVVEVVDVGEVVEDEAEGYPGPLGHGAGGGVRVAGVQQLHQRFGDVVARPLPPGEAAVGGRLLGGRDMTDVGRCRSWWEEAGWGEAEADARLSRSAGRLRGAGRHWEPSCQCGNPTAA